MGQKARYVILRNCTASCATEANLGLEQSSHHGKHPAGCYQKSSYLVGHKLWPALQSTVTEQKNKILKSHGFNSGRFQRDGGGK